MLPIWLNFPSHHNQKLPVLPLAIVGLFLLLVVLVQPLPAHADAGGFPTATPTVTPTSTWTATLPPTTLATLAPTSTFTPLPTVTSVGLLGVQATRAPLVVTPEIIPDTGGSLFSCWPLVIVFLLVGIILAAYLLTRRARLEAQE
jgi:hypothetical protein